MSSDLLRNFKQTLIHCYTYAHESLIKQQQQQQQQREDKEDTKLEDINELTIDPFTIIWFKKLYKFYGKLFRL